MIKSHIEFNILKYLEIQNVIYIWKVFKFIKECNI